jgi:hypothetical protein
MYALASPLHSPLNLLSWGTYRLMHFALVNHTVLDAFALVESLLW